MGMKDTANNTRAPAASHKKRRRPRGDAQNAAVWLYGRHAVAAALCNPARRIRRILATKNAADWLRARGLGDASGLGLEDAKPDALDKLLPTGAVHQGLAIEAEDLPRVRLKEVCAPAQTGRPVVILDQITDPQNIGAVFRVAAAFHARAIIVQERRTPPLSGALAKAAAGAVEIVPCVKVVNIARAIEALNDLGYETVGLAGQSSMLFSAVNKQAPIALALGAEGAGLRPLVAETCNSLVRIPIADAMESLNVSTAAAVALYALNAAN